MDAQSWRSEQRTRRVTTDRHEFEVAYREVGSGDPVTVFLHGIPTWSYLYRDACEGVDHALLPDLPGYGYTRHLGAGGYDRSVAAQADYVEAFLEALGLESIHLVAHDIGGGVALRLALQTDVVDRLVLSNATTYDSWPIEAIAELGLPNRARNMTYKELERTLRTLFSNGMYNEKRVTDAFVDGMIEPFLDRPVTDLPRTRFH